jgi:hypothetical protein
MMLLQSCDTSTPEPGPTVGEAPTPDEGVQVLPGASYKVKRWDGMDNVWATLTATDTFDHLNHDAWNDLVANGVVTTDSTGEAELCEAGAILPITDECDEDACRIFVYGDSDFGAYWCPISGLTDCTGRATLVVDDCPVTFTTLSADVTGLGTWFSVTYLWDTQVTLVIVGEGEVEVTPVRELTLADELPSLDDLPPRERVKAWSSDLVTDRARGESVPVRVEPDTTPARYFYTAPDDVLEELQLPQEIPAREWLRLDSLPLLRGHLEVLEPRLGPWLERIWQRSEADDIPLGPLLPVSSVRVVTFGELWEDRRIMGALVLSVEWKALTGNFQEPFYGISLYRGSPAGPEELWIADARTEPHDYDESHALLDEADYDGSPVLILYPAEDDQLQATAKRMRQYILEGGFQDVGAQGFEIGSQEDAIRASLEQVPGIILVTRGSR